MVDLLLTDVKLVGDAQPRSAGAIRIVVSRAAGAMIRWVALDDPPYLLR
jgi:hypothetical protein